MNSAHGFTEGSDTYEDLAKQSYSRGFNDACESIIEVLEESNSKGIRYLGINVVKALIEKAQSINKKLDKEV